jgi:hypothetical protein
MNDTAMPRTGSAFTPVRVALIAWAALSIFLLYANWQDILLLDLSDADDAMRMAQVRDLLGGQRWWDLMQYRINPAHGGALMHWSRLVDAPIAAGILILKPFFGEVMAERIVMTSWPLIMGAMLSVACAAGYRHLSDRRIDYTAPLLLVMMGFVVTQFRPLHIDHHGWQILMAMIMIWQAIRPPSAQAGLIGGVAAATLLAISIEGLPIVTLFAALSALRWAIAARAGDRQWLIGYIGALAGGALVLQFATRGPQGLTGGWCDSLSAPYLAAFVVAAAGILAIVRWAPRTPAARLAALGVAGAAAAAALLAVAPQCARGPFASLDPVVVRYWYTGVLEGQPVWAMTLHDAVFLIVPSLLGLLGSLAAWRGAADATARRNWATIMIALAGAVTLSLLVMRSVSTAHVYALPGCAWLLAEVFTKARRLASPLPRVAATVLAALLLPLPASVAAVSLLGSVLPGAKADEKDYASAASFDKICLDPPTIARLEKIAPTTMMTPIDLGPSFLFWTHHRVVATGHHRNKDAMADAIRTFISDPAVAEPLVRKHRASLIVYCRWGADMIQYSRANRGGLAARLYADRPPAWLERIDIGGSKGLSVWRVKPPAE